MSELLAILIPTIIIIALMVYYMITDDCFDGDVVVTVFIVVFVFFGISNIILGSVFISPTYHVKLEHSKKLYPIVINGKIQKDKYYILKPQENIIIINDGTRQTEYNTQEQNIRIKFKNNEDKINSYTYAWNDNEFPNNIFINIPILKCDYDEIIVSKSQGIIK